MTQADGQTLPVLPAEEPVEGSHFVATYPPFSSWRADQCPAVETALDHPARVDPGSSLGLYVHLPFCSQRCDFCYYLSHDDRPGQIHDYLEALARELGALVQREALRGRRPDFVYFGGGTPSLLSTPQVRSLLAGLEASWSWQGAREVTFECAPRTVTADKLAVLRDWGVNRVSLGVQQLDDEVLASSGRVHRSADVHRALELIRAAGFEVVNVDLIVGMVGETRDTFEQGLARVLQWAPECVTLYQLEVPLNTPLSRDPERWRRIPPWPVKRQRLLQAFEGLEASGYTVANAYMAVREPERHCFHYMTEQYRGADLLGIGVASFSYLQGVHWQNVPSLDRHGAMLAAGRLPLQRARVLTAEDRARREALLGLKLGFIERARFRARHGLDPGTLFGFRWRELVEQGFVRDHPEGWRVTRSGLALVDRVIPSLYAPEFVGLRYS